MNQEVKVSELLFGNLLHRTSGQWRGWQGHTCLLNTSCSTRLVPVPVSVAVPPMLAAIDWWAIHWTMATYLHMRSRVTVPCAEPSTRQATVRSGDQSKWDNLTNSGESLSSRMQVESVSNWCRPVLTSSPLRSFAWSFSCGSTLSTMSLLESFFTLSAQAYSYSRKVSESGIFTDLHQNRVHYGNHHGGGCRIVDPHR